MVIAAFVVSLLALVIAAWSAWRTNKNGSRTAAAAERSASAAEDSRDAAMHAAAAAETQTRLAVADAERYEVPWLLSPAGGDTVRLTNRSRVEIAYDVRVVDLSNGTTPHLWTDGVEMGPGESRDFFGIRPDSDNPENRIEVRWRRTPDGVDQPPWQQVADL